MAPKKTVTNEIIVPKVTGLTKIESALWQVRELCRKHHLQTWGKESLANQIYQDLLFIYHVPRLCREGILDIDIQRVGDGKISEVSYASLLSLKEADLINASFKRLWKELQRCILKDLFYGREFTLFAVEKKNPERYMGVLVDLFKYFASIELQGYDSNAGYTYFKKDLNKAVAKTFGQFYTPSTVTSSVVKLVDPKIGEKTLDPSCGSCSFLAESANYIVEKQKVDIKTAFMDLYGTEVEFNIYAEGILNMFINFGLLPDMKGRIREVDALLDMARSEDQFDKIVANPPFGADASTFHEFYFKTQMEPKGNRMVKKIILNPEVKCEIPFTKTKESAILFFQFIVQKLKKGGKAGVVMSSTILNDGFKEMMEWFLKCCSLEKVVINPAGTFKEQGTGIETFSFIFTKGKPTTTVEIVMLGAEDVAVRTLTLDQIKEAGWKLQLKEEEKKEAYTGVYELKKLGDVCDDMSTGKNIPSSERVDGEFKFFTCSRDYATHNEFHYEGTYIVHGSRGSTIDESVFLTENEKFAIGTSMFLTKVKNEDELQSKFLYYYLKFNRSIVNKHVNSTAIPMISKTNYYTIEIPCPPLPIQQEIVANLNCIFADPQDMKDCLAFTDKAMDLMLKDPTGKKLEDVLGGLRLKRAYLTAAASVKSQMAAVVRSVGARRFERKKLGDLYDCPKTIKRFNSGDRDPTGNVPFFNGKWSCPDGTHTDYSFDLNSPYLVMIKDGGGDHNSDTVGMGKFFKVQGKCAITSHNMVLTPKPENGIEYDFIYHYLTMNAKSIRDMATYSINLGGISKESIVNYEIPLPPLPIQHEVLAILNEMEAELATLEQMAAKAEQRAKFILDGYLTPPPTQSTEVVEATVAENEVVSEPPKLIKKVPRIKKVSST